MKSLTTLASAAALAISIAAASSANAAVFADFTPNTNDADFAWVKTANTNGTFATLGSNATLGCTGCSAVHFSFLDPALATLQNVSASLQINSSVTGVAATHVGPQYTQQGVGGGFTITYYDPTHLLGSTQNIGGFNLVNGVSNLLSGSFTNASITGAGGGKAGGSGSANLAIGTGGTLTFTSDFEGFAGLAANSEEFAINLLDAHPGFGASTGKALNSFTANGGGNFSFQSVPEPATWGLMILGFGGLGAVARNRRRVAIATA